MIKGFASVFKTYKNIKDTVTKQKMGRSVLAQSFLNDEFDDDCPSIVIKVQKHINDNYDEFKNLPNFKALEKVSREIDLDESDIQLLSLQLAAIAEKIA